MQLSGSRKRAIENLKVKLGHGGTLDPMATGVLIVGVGKGTKQLNRFLECTKTYECVVLFGAATDSYDAVGKVVGRKEYKHVTRELVEEKLKKFRGEIQQKPSVFSALKVDGKKMYEYAREGGEIPEVKARPVEVHELELVEWLEPGSHEFKWPEEEVGGVEKEGAERLMGVRAQDARGRKRSRSVEKEEEVVTNEMSHSKKPRTDSEPAMSGALPVRQIDTHPEPTPQANGQPPITSTPTEDPSKLDPEPTSTPRLDGEPAMSGGLLTETIEPAPQSSTPMDTSESNTETPPQPPAARLRMTVSSGFYVRSLCHDLGLACSSFGLMSSLVRTRQGDYALDPSTAPSTPAAHQHSVLSYADLSAGPEVWEPKVQKYLEDFMETEGWEAEEVESDEVYEAVRKEREAEKRERDQERSFQGGRREGNKHSGKWRGKGKGRNGGGGGNR
ncbi:pseudouridine synthase [Lophiostoma macrostomum CBS 122681]|uniref:tRNA pseudouridine(55) synthase n=1 Tax=Lophiostoma macrostomum CBS 122681 TaxID=1314788 RepID=A0A6A6TGB2_9PLEO|nr:pseudouridine synthase [Lophiostoma macrostomum CBS 122681]